MKKSLSGLVIVFFLAFVLLTVLYSFAEEKITLTTYYPAPYGIYKEVKADQMAIGPDYRTLSLTNGTLLVESAVVINETFPYNSATTKLQIGSIPVVPASSGFPDPEAQDLVISNTASGGMSVLSSMNQKGTIAFVNEEGLTHEGTISYNHFTKSLTFGLDGGAQNITFNANLGSNMCIRIPYGANSGVQNCPPGYVIAYSTGNPKTTTGTTDFPTSGFFTCCWGCSNPATSATDTTCH